VTNTIEPTEKLGDLVTKDPGRARPFELLKLDYCCGGQRTLAEACAQRGLDTATVIAMLVGLQEGSSAPRAEAHDVARATIAGLCDHIVEAHHERLRRDLPRITELLAKVARAHGKGHRELYDLQRLFAGMRSNLEEHLATEEETLFPACRALEESGHGPELDEALLAHEGEHDEVGAALTALRELAGDYRLEDALCGTHRVLLHSLHDLELDTHQHVHEENNVLFPRVRERLAAGQGPVPRGDRTSGWTHAAGRDRL